MADPTIANGHDLIKKLRKGKLPQMVDWFDPLVLGMVAIRTLISTTIGEYADQRPMQEAADGETDDERLITRHDYSKLTSTSPRFVVPPDADVDNPNCHKNEKYPTIIEVDDQHFFDRRLKRQLELNANAFWVDFIADLGDGFEATYAMASLLAAPSLEVRGTARREKLDLPAGQILIFGGDLAYPNATLEEYRTRCLDPYDWAFTEDAERIARNEISEPRRELFFVAGNHDWYDGLSAFTHQFCYEASAVGGWRCTQQRSYFALKLPYDWWIWGVDVALGDSIDVGQLHYFQKMVGSMDRRSKARIVIILHAPDWTKKNYKALAKICQLAQERGEVCAILAGDLHHYSRYETLTDEEANKAKTIWRNPPLQLIVSGGGGAFAHPTHDLKREIEVEPAVAKWDMPGGRPSTKLERFRFCARKFYPTRGQSRLLALRNFWLPLHNWRFAALLGFVYLLYAWVFHTTASKGPASIASDFSGMRVGNAADVATAAQDNPMFFFMLLGLWIGLVFYVDANLSNRFLKWLNGPVRAVLGTLHYSAHITALLYVSAISMALATTILNPVIGAVILTGKVVVADLLQIVGADAGVHIQRMNDCIDRLDWSAVSPPCVGELLGTNALYIATKALAFAALSIVIGGLIGGFIFGCYWAITSALFGMHPDAFSALAIKNYKNFLRMQFEEDTLTIYPIALDRVPGAKDWRQWEEKTDASKRHKPLIVPKGDMTPRLIETPIKIERKRSALEI